MGSAVKLMRIVAQGQRARGNCVGSMDAGVAGGSREAGRKVVAGADCRWCQWMGTCMRCASYCKFWGQCSRHANIERVLYWRSCSLHDFVNSFLMWDPKISCAGRARVTVSKGEPMSLGTGRWRGDFPAGWAEIGPVDVELCDATNFCVNSSASYSQTVGTIESNN